MADTANLQHSRSNGHDHHPHFLVVAYGIQSHVNPAQDLARRLASIDASVVCTLSVHVAAHRRMFPSLASPDEETTDGVISYVPFSDGYDDRTEPIPTEDESARSRGASFRSLSSVISRLAARGRPVTCVVCTMALPAVLDVARKHGVPLAVFWNQPATVLAAYYHYYHGYKDLIASNAFDPACEVTLPGLQPLRMQCLPSFLVEKTSIGLSKMVIDDFQELFEFIDREKPMVLVNTFNELEATTLVAMQPYLKEVLFIGHFARSSARARIHIFQKDKKSYMEWLDAQQERSVIYISFGSVLTYSKQQLQEIAQGLEESDRPYLWVVRKDGRDEEVESFLANNTDHRNGMVIEWCDQLDVLSHSSIGCFVTHCGWNSTVESLAFGVPMVTVPNWSDQPTIAYLVEEKWRVGTRVYRDDQGIIVGTQLAKEIDFIMGDNEVASKIRQRANDFKQKIHEEATRGEKSEMSLQIFAKTMIGLGKGSQSNLRAYKN
uniref:Glycosyltransferase n=1 Tax=Oryza brachyantha TaxID=4533 RepID=G2XM80_ORYBR|nr:hypothetical_protein [Oryza brachyantha]